MKYAYPEISVRFQEATKNAVTPFFPSRSIQSILNSNKKLTFNITFIFFLNNPCRNIFIRTPRNTYPSTWQKTLDLMMH